MIEYNKHNENEITIAYFMTWACNNRCDYCCVGLSLDNKVEVEREVLVVTANAVIKLQNDNPEYHICVSLLGGEPLMVVDDVIDFIDRVNPHGIEIDLTSNLNFDPNSDVIRKVLEYKKTGAKFRVMASWHEVSNRDYVKANILLMKDFVRVGLLLCDDNLVQVYDEYLWLKSIGVPFHVSCIRQTQGPPLFTLFDSPKYQQMINDSTDNEVLELNTFDDKRMSIEETREMDLLNISKKYYTICRMSALTITKRGDITTQCDYPFIGGNIKNKDVEIKDVFCNGHFCRCTTDNYKKLLREKK